MPHNWIRAFEIAIFRDFESGAYPFKTANWSIFDYKALFNAYRMKKFYIAAIASLFALTTQAQSFEFQNGEYEVYAATSDPLNFELSSHVDIVNVSGQDIEAIVSRENQEGYIEGADNRFCWGGACFSNDDDVSLNTESMTDGQVVVSDGIDGFTGYYNFNGNLGLSTVKYCITAVGNPEISSCFTVNYCVANNCATLSVDEVGNSLGEIGDVSPNPVKNISSLSYRLPGIQNASLTIYSLTGEAVKTISLSNPQGIIFIDASEFESGIYFYSLENNSARVAMKKMIVAN